ncbi:hypothetical protein LguiB_024910 [Lonicera macranthoides]
MATVTSTPSNNTAIPQKLTLENKNNFRDVSFSSYLNGAEKTFFLLKLTEPNQTPSSPNEHLYLGKKKVQDGEIGVFGAEKYFQGEMDKENSRIPNKGTTTTKHHHENDEPPTDIIASVKPKTLPRTPSVWSESSWNSQSALLKRFPRKQMCRKRNKVHRKSFLSNIRCNCYCNDKNSVDIDEEHITDQRIIKQPMKEMNCKKIEEMEIGLKREDCFSFPILNSTNGNLSAKANQQKEDNNNNDEMRNSLEVFGSPVVEKGKRSLSIERKKLSMLSWDAEEEIETLESPNEARCNDNLSDASSDLFEIESFSTNTNSFLARESSTCYAPSEASIEWSVVTADYEDTKNMNRTVASPVKEGQKRRPGILSGCKSQKAVNVAGDAYRTNYKSTNPQGNHRLDSLKSVTRGEHVPDRTRSASLLAPHPLYIEQPKI